MTTLRTTDSMDARVLGWSGLVVAGFCLAVLIGGWFPSWGKAPGAEVAYVPAPVTATAQ
jgi:hypothetical protein